MPVNPPLTTNESENDFEHDIQEADNANQGQRVVSVQKETMKPWSYIAKAASAKKKNTQQAMFLAVSKSLKRRCNTGCGMRPVIDKLADALVRGGFKEVQATLKRDGVAIIMET